MSCNRRVGWRETTPKHDARWAEAPAPVADAMAWAFGVAAGLVVLVVLAALLAR